LGLFGELGVGILVFDLKSQVVGFVWKYGGKWEVGFVLRRRLCGECLMARWGFEWNWTMECVCALGLHIVGRWCAPGALFAQQKWKIAVFGGEKGGGIFIFLVWGGAR